MCGIRQRALHPASAKHLHTAHVSSTIRYPHHPQCGVTVTIVRRCRSFGQHQVQVALPNGDQLVVPEWMLDEERCQGMEITTQPVVALSALQALRVLLDAQIPPSEQCGTVASEACSPGGACREPTTPGSSSLGDHNHTRASSSSADTLPRAAQSHAARRRERNNRRGER